MPEDLRDPDSGGKFVWDATEDSKFQRQAAIRASARVAFHQSPNRQQTAKGASSEDACCIEAV